MSESEALRCGMCLLPIHPAESGIRHYGTTTAHSEHRCVELLRIDRDKLRAMWERDSTALGTAIGQRDTARAVAEDNRARYVSAERDRAELVEALTGLVRYLGTVSDTGYDPFAGDKFVEPARALLARIEGPK